MSQAGYDKLVRFSTEIAAAPTVASLKKLPATSATLNHGGDVLDDTDMLTMTGDADFGFRSRILGLRDMSISATLNWTPGNADLITVRDAWLNRTRLTYQYIPGGTVANGFQFVGYVETLNLSGDVSGLETAELSIQADSAIVVAAET